MQPGLLSCARVRETCILHFPPAHRQVDPLTDEADMVAEKNSGSRVKVEARATAIAEPLLVYTSSSECAALFLFSETRIADIFFTYSSVLYDGWMVFDGSTRDRGKSNNANNHNTNYQTRVVIPAMHAIVTLRNK